MTGLTGMFSTTMNKIGEAMSFSNGSGLCVLVVFMVAVFIFLWRVLRYPVCNTDEGYKTANGRLASRNELLSTRAGEEASFLQQRCGKSATPHPHPSVKPIGCSRTTSTLGPGPRC